MINTKISSIIKPQSFRVNQHVKIKINSRIPKDMKIKITAVIMMKTLGSIGALRLIATHLCPLLRSKVSLLINRFQLCNLKEVDRISIYKFHHINKAFQFVHLKSSQYYKFMKMTMMNLIWKVLNHKTINLILKKKGIISATVLFNKKTRKNFRINKKKY